MLPCCTRQCRGALCLASIMLPLSAEETCHRGGLDGKFTEIHCRNDTQQKRFIRITSFNYPMGTPSRTEPALTSFYLRLALVPTYSLLYLELQYILLYSGTTYHSIATDIPHTLLFSTSVCKHPSPVPALHPLNKVNQCHMPHFIT